MTNFTQGGRMRIFRPISLAAVVAVAFAVWPASGAMAEPSGQVPLVGTGSAQTGEFTPSGAGDVTQVEFPAGDDDEGPDPFNGTSVGNGDVVEVVNDVY